MHRDRRATFARVALFAVAAMLHATAIAQASGMTFFITSVGAGRGANFGGLNGADGHCERLAEEAGSRGRVWRAYLSTSAATGAPAVNARDRIGNGPWRNAKGVLIANGVAELHGKNNLTKDTALNEKGEVVNGRTDAPNRHDILTGSQPDGTAFPPGEDRTCRNWTSTTEGAAMVGHHDRIGLGDDEASRSWNSSHPSRGCSDEALRSTGGAGLLYCFAMR